MLLAQSTRPVVWTPEGLVAVLTCVALVLIPAVIALLQAIKALRLAERANATSEANATRAEGLQTQMTNVAMNQTPPPAPIDRPKGM
jgi:CHASE3 domain sensor protein